MRDIEKRLQVPVDFKAVAEKGPEFKDPLFPPLTVSLGDDEEMKEIIQRKVQWRRVGEIFRSYRLFKGIDINDVIQGELGDCYFISAITGLSENPNRILKLFMIAKENSHGCYAVTLYVCGAPRTIVLDDYFPALGRMWALTHSKEEEIWVMLLEKAWAKAHGNYGLISGGDSREALSALSGAPTTLMRHSGKDKEQIWRLIKDASRKKYVMSAGGAKAIKGLYSGHAYSLLKAIELNTQNMGTVRLVQIRNPWGEYEWNGDWADNSNTWTPELRLQAGHTIANDGTFFMSFDDYYNLYSYTFICQYIDTYIHSHVVVEQHEACVAFQVLSETRGFFSVHQLTPRMSRAKTCKPLFIELYAYRDQGLQLVKGIINETQAISFSSNPAGSNAIGTATVETVLPPGLYIMHAFYLNNDVPAIKYICFTAYSSKGVDLVHLPGKTSVKSITRAELLRTVDAYMKSKSINPVKKKLTRGTKEMCMNGHPVTYVGPQEGVFRCDYCRQQKQRDKGRYVCSKCMYDVCTDCRPAPAAPIKVPAPEPPKPKEEVKHVPASPPKNSVSSLQPIMSKEEATTCPKKHPLVCKQPPRFSDRLFICCSCGRANRFSSPRWICETCSYLLCDTCKKPTDIAIAPIPGNPPASAHPTCLRNHRLNFDFTIYPGNVYLCDECDRQGKCTCGRWRCSVCNYDLCTYCAPPPKIDRPVPTSIYGRSGSAPIASSVITTCTKGHMLWYSTYSYLSGEYECNKCFRHANCKDGRWFCIQCEYDICLSCRPPPEDIEKYTKTCNNGHVMIQSTNRYNEQDAYYRCSFCRKAKSVEDNRWWCPICNYDVCNECADNDIENLEWPEPLDEEERRCKDNKHEFVNSKETMQFFTCQKEEEEKSGSYGRFICLKCGMIQCGKCAETSGKKIEEQKDSPGPGRVAYEFNEVEASAGFMVELQEGCDNTAVEVTEKPEPNNEYVPKKKNEDKKWLNCKASCCSVLQITEHSLFEIIQMQGIMLMMIKFKSKWVILLSSAQRVFQLLNLFQMFLYLLLYFALLFGQYTQFLMQLKVFFLLLCDETSQFGYDL
eukprot:TRINITY_DN190_c0_g1_i1.p1 TRINITY_DN190_c0_g1~~TRINITY_DN190_c0_g1_i1.p1  ORF type:complete len:1066 (+),score=81.34 TRINITY_DN190_c0_g1_i1:2683-5880(+)